jgi:nitrous oxide reductase
MRKGIVLSVVVFLCFSNSVVRIAENKGSPIAERVIKVGNPPPANVAIKEVNISAKKYEYNPGSVVVPINTLMRIHLKALDREHGFEIKSIKDSCVKFKPDEPVIVEFYADKAGEFEFTCCKFCGFGHKEMKGEIIIK